MEIFGEKKKKEYNYHAVVQLPKFCLTLRPHGLSTSLTTRSQYVTTGKTIALIIWTFVGRVMSLLFSTLSRFVIVFLLRRKRLLISWLHSLSAVILEPKKRKSVTASTYSPSICHRLMELDAMILVFSIVLSQLFHSPPSPSSRGSLVPLHLLTVEWYHPHI